MSVYKLQRVNKCVNISTRLRNIRASQEHQLKGGSGNITDWIKEIRHGRITTRLSFINGSYYAY